MKIFKSLINNRAIARLNKTGIGIGRRSHRKQIISRWYNKLGDSSIIKIGSFFLLIIAVWFSYRTYNEMMRSPKLELSVKECWADTSGRLHIIPGVINVGNERAIGCDILIMVPSQFEFESSSFIVADSMVDPQRWSCQYPSSIPFLKDKEHLLTRFDRSISFSIKLISNRRTSLKFFCYITHNKGTDEDTLTIDPSKCH